MKKGMILALMSIGLMGGSAINANAAEYNYSSAQFQNYVELNGGATFSLTGVQSISNGSQAPKTSGNPCGVQYQIYSGSSLVKYVTRTGVYDRNLSVDLSNTNAKGSCKVRLMNYYSSTYTQTATGKFVY